MLSRYRWAGDEDEFWNGTAYDSIQYVAGKMIRSSWRGDHEDGAVDENRRGLRVPGVSANRVNPEL